MIRCLYHIELVLRSARRTPSSRLRPDFASREGKEGGQRKDREERGEGGDLSTDRSIDNQSGSVCCVQIRGGKVYEGARRGEAAMPPPPQSGGQGSRQVFVRLPHCMMHPTIERTRRVASLAASFLGLRDGLCQPCIRAVPCCAVLSRAVLLSACLCMHMQI